MRILMLNHEFTITGASTAFFRLAVHLRESGHDIVVTPMNPAHGPMADRYAAAGIPVQTQITLGDFQLAIGNTICAAQAVIRIDRRLPTIWIINEAEVGLRLLQERPAWTEAFRLATSIIYNTPFQHEVFRSFTYALDPGKFHAVPLGVDVNKDRIARDHVPPKSAPFRVVQVGTIHARKRPGDLVLAVSLLGGHVECAICGMMVAIEPQAKAIVDADPAHYRLLGECPNEEVLAWVESADVFVLASDSETQSLAAYEAAALARPLVLSDLPCYRGVFSHGRNCLLYPAGSIDMLAQSIAMLLRSDRLRDALGRAAQQTARRYTNQAFFAEFDGIMGRTLAGG